LTNHIYPGAKYDSKSKDLFTPESNAEYFLILDQFRDKIVIEVVAHDHISDVRYHSNGDSPKYFYHNMIVSPGVTPIDGNNPGVATFEISKSTMIPSNLVLYFLSLEKTYGWKSIPKDLASIPFRTVEFSEFGLTDLTAKDLSTFKNQLQVDDKLTYRYLVSKVGYDPSDPVEYEKGMGLYIDDLGIITSSKRKTYKFIC
jgi:hypothetical protein